MEYCKECGTKLETGDLFCEECGASINGVPQKIEEKIKRKSLTKKEKIIGGMVLSVFILLFISFKIGERYYSEEKQYERIISIVESKDEKLLSENIITYDNDLELTADNLKNFTNLLKEDSSFLENIKDELKYSGSSGAFYIEKKGKKLGIYDAYQLVVEPIYGELYTNADDFKLKINNEDGSKLISEDQEYSNYEVGPFLPGVYEFELEGTIDGSELFAEEQVTFVSPGYSNELDLNLHGYTFSIYSNLIGASVFVNEKEIGIIENQEDYSFGPIQFEEDMELYISKSFSEDDKLESAKIKMSEEESYYEFDDFVIADQIDIEHLLSEMYDTATSISAYEDHEDEIKDFTKYFVKDSPAFEKQRIEIQDYAKQLQTNEDVNRIVFEVDVVDYEQVSSTEYEVEYEVTYRTMYTYQADKSNEVKHYAKEAVVVFEPTNNPDADFESHILEISNEELLYDES